MSRYRRTVGGGSSSRTRPSTSPSKSVNPDKEKRRLLPIGIIPSKPSRPIQRPKPRYISGDTVEVEGRTYTYNGRYFVHRIGGDNPREVLLDPETAIGKRDLEIASLASGWDGEGYTFSSESNASKAAELLYGSRGRVRGSDGSFSIYKKKKKGGNVFDRIGGAIGDGLSSIDDRITRPISDTVGDIGRSVGDELNDLGGSVDDRVTQPIVDLTEDVGDAAVRASDYLAKELKDQAEFVFVDPIREIKERTEGTVVGRGLDFISENVVDPIDDLKDNPYVQVAAYFVPGVGPILGPSLQIASKLDNGGELTGQDVVNLALSAASVAGTVDPKLIKAGKAAAKVQAGEEPIDVFVQLYAEDVLSALDNPALENGLETAIRTAGGEDLTTALAATYGQDYLRSEEFKSGASQFLSDKGMNQSTIDLIFEQDKGAELFNQVAYGEDPVAAVASIYSKDIAEGLFGEDGNYRASTIAALKAVPKADDVDFSDPAQVGEFLKGTYDTYVEEGGTLPEFEFTASLFGEVTEGEDGEGGFNFAGINLPSFSGFEGLKGGVDWAAGKYAGLSNYLSGLGYDFGTVFGAIGNPLEFLDQYGITLPEGIDIPLPDAPEFASLEGDLDLVGGSLPDVPTLDVGSIDVPLPDVPTLDVGSIDVPELPSFGSSELALDQAISGLDMPSLDASLDLSLPSFDLGLDLALSSIEGGTSEEEEENKDPNEFQGLDYDANILGNALARIKSLKV